MSLRMTEEEYRAFLERRKAGNSQAAAPEPPEAPPKRPKYGNRRVEVNGMKFDSQHEADVYADLMMRVRAGELKTVVRQVAFDLPGGIRYFADFVAIDHENRVTVYDAKSEITRQNRVYINKKKQMLACWDIEIVEV